MFRDRRVFSAGFLDAHRFNRRALIARGTVLTAGIALSGCVTGTIVAAQSPATATSATAVPDGDAVTAIVDAANAFLATLGEDEQAAVLFDWTDTAQKQRWSNFPEGLFDRDGLMWGDIAEDAQNAWLALMQATLSEEGYTRVMAEWAADDALASQDGGGGAVPAGNGNTPPSGNGGNLPGGNGGGMSMSYGRQYYWVAIIGTPSETQPWQWQFGGHHVTVNATVVNGNVALTPSFIGVQPATYTDADGNEVRPLGDISDEAFALVNALAATQQQSAILGDTYIDLVLGPGQDGKTLQPEGLVASDLNDDQRDMLISLIGYYTGMVTDELAAARLDEVTSTLDQTYFVWYGPTEEGNASYFRVAGPRIVIEFSPQQMGGNAADHIHGIYRDPENDYGAAYGA